MRRTIAGRPIRKEREPTVTRQCTDCGETFELPATFTGTASEDVCSHCLDLRSDEFVKKYLS